MATAEVQHPVPTAVHDGSCFQEEESHKVPVQDMPGATEVEEKAPGAEEVQVHANGISEDEMKGQDEEDSDKENNPTDHHKYDAAVVAIDAGDHDDDRLMQAVAQEVEAKLGIVHDDDVVVDSAAAADDGEAKPPKEEADERRGEVTRKAAKAKAVVVPVDDDGDGPVDGQAAAAPAEAASEAP